MKYTFKGNIRLLITAAVLLCVNTIVTATDYFIYGTSDDYTGWSDNAEASGSSPTFSITIYATTGRNYYVAYTGNSTSYSNISTDSGVSVTNSGCSNCSNTGRQERDSKYYSYFSVSTNSYVTVSFNTSTLAYTISDGSAGDSYALIGDKTSVWGSCAWEETNDCDAANALTLEDGYYTRTYTKVDDDIIFRMRKNHSWVDDMQSTYDSIRPLLNGVTEKGTDGVYNLKLSSVQGSHRKKTSFNFTIKYDATNNKTYLVTTPHLYFKGPMLGDGGSDWDTYHTRDWTSVNLVDGNFVFTYDYTVTAAQASGTKLFTLCTLGKDDGEPGGKCESDGFKLPNFESEVTLVGVQINSGTYNNYEPTISIVEGHKMRLRVTRYGAESYKVELIDLDRSTPVARIGKKLTEITSEGATQGNVRVSAYIAATGCADVDRVKIYYANNSSFRNGEGYKSASVEKTLVAAINANNQCAEYLYLTAAEVSGVVGKGETLYVRVKAINEDDITSPYSDIAKLTYQYNKFIAENQTIDNATACEGRHEFKWTGEGGMFNPVPDGYTVKYDNSSGDDASSEFTLVGDKMVWSDLSKYDDDASSEVHTYYFTASKEGYTSTSATATFTLTATALEGVTVTILENGDPVTEVISADPWVEKTFTATRSDSNSGILWECPENSTLKVSDNGATAVFKGEVPSSTPYVIKARAANENCGRSEKTEASIMVDAITETCSR